MAVAAEKQLELVAQQSRLLRVQNWIVGIEAGFLLLALGAAIWAAIEARKSAAAAEEHVVRLERPYITLKFDTEAQVPSLNKPLAVKIGNIGRIFGIIGTPRFQIFVSDAAPEPMTLEDEDYKFGIICEPDKAHMFYVFAGMIKGDIADIGRGNYTAYLLASIPYVHGNRRYETRICLRYDPAMKTWGHDGTDRHNYMT